MLRKEIWGGIEAEYAPDDKNINDMEVNGCVPNPDAEAPVKSDMVKVEGEWLPRREPSSRATKGKELWTLEDEYGHGIAFHEAGEVNLDDMSHCHFALISNGDILEPKTIRQALECEYSEEWKAAADDEYRALMKNKTWDLVYRPKDRRVLSNKWVFRIKYRNDGSIDRFKGRPVVRGFEQVHGLDYDETFAPVVRFGTIRTLLAFAIQNDLLIHQIDVVTAFLNGTIDEEMYIEQPEGYVMRGQESKVCKLKRSLYGLKQSPRC